ncbi:MAG: dTDP-4-dehydrorhamnose 3,5-epimerase [Proteobacteria bacterium]|nr:dTDP-4-dehydrorhamnose 3,5-epimerase [Pseudomonadota bacterium]
MQIETTSLSGVLILTPRRFGDARGWFSEVWNKDTLAREGISVDFAQDNHSYSAVPGTVRGLHFQSPPHAQAKLVRCGRGRVFDVAVDIRIGSPTYGRWVGVELSAENGRQLLIPAGFLHGFVTREPDSELLYKCSDVYAPDCDGAVRFDDPDISIDWGIDTATATLSEKDAKAPYLKDFQSPFRYEARP